MHNALVSLRTLLAACLLAGAALALLPSSAQAATSCEAFHHVQTYHPGAGFYRGPAWYYGRTVTVSYDGRSCVTADEPPGHFGRDISGTATVHRGTSTAGRVIDARPFSSVEAWNGVADRGAWPSAWWQCTEANVDYSWSIPGVYTFGVAGRRGTWRWWQSAPGTSLSATSSFNSC